MYIFSFRIDENAPVPQRHLLLLIISPTNDPPDVSATQIGGLWIVLSATFVYRFYLVVWYSYYRRFVNSYSISWRCWRDVRSVLGAQYVSDDPLDKWLGHFRTSRHLVSSKRMGTINNTERLISYSFMAIRTWSSGLFRLFNCLICLIQMISGTIWKKG